MDNIKLLEYSIINPETSLDVKYLCTQRHASIKKYTKRTQDIKNKLIAIREIQKHKNKKALSILFKELQNLLNKDANYSEFGCFINACDNTMEAVVADIKLLEKITILYIKNRDVNDIVPEEWIQALIDKGSSRQKGKMGENKLMEILIKKGYKKAENIKELNGTKLTFGQWKKNGDFCNKKINNVFHQNIGKKNQDKAMDLIIKNKNNYYFLEAKHINTAGGAQDKQIKELVDNLKYKGNINIHFVSFLDGVYFNRIFAATHKNTKLYNQQKDIYSVLKEHQYSYFINTAGFNKMF